MRAVKQRHLQLVETSPRERVERALNELGVPRVVEGVAPTRPTFNRRLKDLTKGIFFRAYRLAQRWGWNIFPSHFYTSEPNVVTLASERDYWMKPSELVGIEATLKQQLTQLTKICEGYRDEYTANLAYQAGSAGAFGPGYGFVEAQCLHAITRHFRPKRIIEVGSGISTLCTLVASKMNVDEQPYEYQMTCIEPYPSHALLSLAERTPVLNIRREIVQKTPLNFFRSLNENDILFIDSSHVAKAGSDVIHLILEVLPVLNRGVVVHIHDIYLPYSYQRDVLNTFIHNNETPFVHAFLLFNSRFEILFSLSQMHYGYPEELKALFPGYSPQPAKDGIRVEGSASQHFPSSLWLRVK